MSYNVFVGRDSHGDACLYITRGVADYLSLDELTTIGARLEAWLNVDPAAQGNEMTRRSLLHYIAKDLGVADEGKTRHAIELTKEIRATIARILMDAEAAAVHPVDNLTACGDQGLQVTAESLAELGPVGASIEAAEPWTCGNCGGTVGAQYDVCECGDTRKWRAE